MKSYRDHFPQLKQTVYGNQLVYLDSAATTLKPQSVIHAITKYYQESCANAGRSGHYFSYQNAQLIESVRTQAKEFFSVPASHDLVFTKHATESLNLVAYLVSQEHDIGSIITSIGEHHANLLPWQRLAKEKGVKLVTLPLEADLRVNLQELETHLKNHNNTVVAIATISNVTGAINDITAIAALCKKYGALLSIDGAQSVGHEKTDLSKISFTYFSASAHKMYGPEGVGILVLPKSDSTKEPVLLGGGIVTKVTAESYTLENTINRFETGTNNTAAISGFGAALTFLSSIGMSTIKQYEQQLAQYFWQKTTDLNIPVRFITSLESMHPIFSFISKTHAHDIGDFLDRSGIAVRAGHHCAQPLHDSLGIPASTRVSFGIYTTEQEIDYFFNTLTQCLKKFG